MDRNSLPKCQIKISSSLKNGELYGIQKKEQGIIDLGIPSTVFIFKEEPVVPKPSKGSIIPL